jgi:hypothetical protein
MWPVAVHHFAFFISSLLPSAPPRFKLEKTL